MPEAKTKKRLASRVSQRRAEIGRLRRDRTRTRMLIAAARVVANRGFDAVTIEDFISAAGVARGTFYNYFQTREQLINELWRHLGKTPFRKIQRAHADDPDPAYRLTSGLRIVLHKASQDHTWGWLVLRITGGDTHLNEEVRSFPLADIRAGMKSGRFAAEDPDIACDCFAGVAAMAVRAVLIGERPADYPERCAFLVLRGLGLGISDARQVANRPLPTLGD